MLRVLNSLGVAKLTNLFPFSPSDLRKEFEVPPYSQSVELGSQIELRCHPPQGKPEPRVSKEGLRPPQQRQAGPLQHFPSELLP